MDCKSVAKIRGYLAGIFKVGSEVVESVYDFKIQARKENERTRSFTRCGFYLAGSAILCFLSGNPGSTSNPFINQK
jgi:hypothetical protein